ncbi:MAG: hypothetical protein EKK48_30705 [Candidatus Melainabacteria bacterium]|nr:MAG: hypothetical protein EKK48_30705 [Candidatus Melainabacteria bacterium]
MLIKTPKRFTYKVLVCSLLIGLIVFGADFCCVGGVFTAKQVVNDNFNMSGDQVTNLKGRGETLLDGLGLYHHWVYFSSTTPVTLKDLDKYQVVAPKDLPRLAWEFAHEMPEATALSDTPNLSGFERRHYSKSIDRKYLLVNNRTHEYFFSDEHTEPSIF